MLISLKKLVIQRAKVTGHESLADKFDVKMLRALGICSLKVLLTCHLYFWTWLNMKSFVWTFIWTLDPSTWRYMMFPSVNYHFPSSQFCDGFWVKWHLFEVLCYHGKWWHFERSHLKQSCICLCDKLTVQITGICYSSCKWTSYSWITPGLKRGWPYETQIGIFI